MAYSTGGHMAESLPSRDYNSCGQTPQQVKRKPNNFKEEIVAVIRHRIINESCLCREEIESIIRPLEEIIPPGPREEVDFDHESVRIFCGAGLKILECKLSVRAKFVASQYCERICKGENICEQYCDLRKYLKSMRVGFEHSSKDFQPLLSIVSLLALNAVQAGFHAETFDIAKAAIMFVGDQWGICSPAFVDERRNPEHKAFMINLDKQRYQLISSNRMPATYFQIPDNYSLVPSGLSNLPTKPINLPDGLPPFAPSTQYFPPPDILSIRPEATATEIPEDLPQEILDALEEMRLYESSGNPDPNFAPQSSWPNSPVNYSTTEENFQCGLEETDMNSPQYDDGYYSLDSNGNQSSPCEQDQTSSRNFWSSQGHRAGDGASPPSNPSNSPVRQTQQNKRPPNNFQEEIVAVIRRRIINEYCCIGEELRPMLQPLEEIIPPRARENIDFDHKAVLDFCDEGLRTLERDFTHRFRLIRRECTRNISDARNVYEQRHALGSFLRRMHVDYEHSPNDLQPLLSMVSLLASDVFILGYTYLLVDIARVAIDFVTQEWRVGESNSLADDWEYTTQMVACILHNEQRHQRSGFALEEAQFPSPTVSVPIPVPPALLHLPTQPIVMPEVASGQYSPGATTSSPKSNKPPQEKIPELDSSQTASTPTQQQLMELADEASSDNLPMSWEYFE